MLFHSMSSELRLKGNISVLFGPCFKFYPVCLECSYCVVLMCVVIVSLLAKYSKAMFLCWVSINV